MSKKKNKSPANKITKEEKHTSGGALMGLRSGMKSIAGTDGKKEKPPTLLEKIFDIIFYVALVAFVGWFLYKKITM